MTAAAALVIGSSAIQGQAPEPHGDAIDSRNQARAAAAAAQAGPPGTSAYVARFHDALLDAYEPRNLPSRRSGDASQPADGSNSRSRRPLYSPNMIGDTRLAVSLAQMLQRTQIWLGKPVENGTFKEVVLIQGASAGEICTGTLIAPDTILTAAHCLCRNVSVRVLFGDDVSTGIPTPVMATSMMASSCSAPALAQDDIGILHIAPSAVPAAQLARMDWVPAAGSGTVVGFGEDEETRSGKKQMANPPIVSASCAVASDPQEFGCTKDREIVAGGHREPDPCHGDSGGPFFVTAPDGKLYVAGTTARSVEPPGGCGAGSVFERLDKRRTDWLKAQNVGFHIGD